MVFSGQWQVIISQIISLKFSSLICIRFPQNNVNMGEMTSKLFKICVFNIFYIFGKSQKLAISTIICGYVLRTFWHKNHAEIPHSYREIAENVRFEWVRRLGKTSTLAQCFVYGSNFHFGLMQLLFYQTSYFF